MKFRPILKTLIWGGEKIIPYKGLNIDQCNVGESWELSGVSGSESVVADGELAGHSITELLDKYGAELLGKANYQRFGNEFPLLIKFIDAKQDLSIQVHPNDELAFKRHKSKGKTEMWYVVNADKGAKLLSGFSREVTPQEYVSCVEDNMMESILQEYEVSQGDLFFLPAGRIHAIGAGCFVAEIQQTSNITYRIYDYNRTDKDGNIRELHTEQSVDAIDYSFEADYRTHYNRMITNSEVDLVNCDYFTTELLALTQPFEADYSTLDSFVIYICVEGKAVVNGVSLQQGETLLLAATEQKACIDTIGCKLLVAYIQ